MALTDEWKHRIERWEEWLWKGCYRPLGHLELRGFTTSEKLGYERAVVGNFTDMPTGTAWGAQWEYGWFKTQVNLPDEAKGRRIALRLNAGGESLVWINGRVEGSVGWAHKEITLTRSGVPGEAFDVVLEAYAGHGRITCGDGPNPWGYETVPVAPAKQTQVGESTFGVWMEEVYQLAIDFSTLFELRGRVDPLSLRASEIDEGLMDVTKLVDFELPEIEFLETVQVGRARLKTLLDCKNGSTMPTLYGFGHAHIDVAWLWPWAETERKIARTAINQLALFDEYPEYKFLQSQPHLYWMLKQDYPELYERFKAAVKTGKVIPDGAMWVEADTNVTGGESLIRQVITARRFFKDEFDFESSVLWLPDVFGYSGALPQILAGCKVEGFTTQKITWAYGGGDPFPYNTFWWEGIDGTAIPAHIFTDYNSQTRPNAIMDRWNTRLQKNGINSLIFAFGWGDGGGGPTRDHTEFLRRCSDLEGLPKVKMASPSEFFADLKEKGLPKERYVGELYFQAHRGTYTSQAKTKKGNRRSEFALHEAELWASAARTLNGYPFSAKTLELTWRKLLLNQFHDILPGSSIHRVYEEAELKFSEVINEARSIAEKAAQTFVKENAGVTVFNSLSWPRHVLVDTPSGQAEVDVPAFGWKSVKEATAFHKGESAVTASVMENGDFRLENDLICATFNSQGEIISLMDKVTNREQMAAAGNHFCMYKDTPDIFDAWDLNSMTEDLPVALNEPGEIVIVQSGPLEASLRLTRQLHQSKLVQTISLRRGSRRLDFATGIDWQESHKLLKVNFPVTIHAEEAIHEIQFGHLRRPTHKSRPYDADRFEVSNHKWSALAEENRGVAVLNDCKYGLSVRGNSINLTLLKSALAPDMTADKGFQTFTYSLFTWNGSFGDCDVVKEAYELNTPVMVVPGDAGEGWLFFLDAANIVIETVKPAEDGTQDVIVRMYEAKRSSTRCTLTTSLPVKAVAQTNLVEDERIALGFQDGKVELDFRPFEIKTLRLEM